MALFAGHTTVLAPEFDAEEVWRAVERHKVNLLFFTGDAMGRPLLDALESGDYELVAVPARQHRRAVLPSLKDRFIELLPNRIITDSIGSSRPASGHQHRRQGRSQAGGPRVMIDRNTVVLDDKGNEVAAGPGRAASWPSAETSRSATTRDEEKTRQTFRLINGCVTRSRRLRHRRAGRHRDDARPWFGVDQHRRGEGVPGGGRSRAQGHPDVFDALVVGVPDPRYGQHVAAVIAPRAGARPSLAELDAFVRSDIAGYKGAAQPVAGRRGETLAGRQARLRLGRCGDPAPAGRRGAREGLAPR